MILINNRYEKLWLTKGFQDKATSISVSNWLNNDFLTFKWWLLLIVLIVPWIIWLKLVDRKRILEVLLFGSLASIITTLLDTFGSALSFWVYPIKFIPILPRALPLDYGMVTVGFMLIYQYYEPWKSYAIALTFMAIIYAFIGGPLATWLEFYLPLKWRYYYSFVFYIIAGLVLKLLMLKVKNFSYKVD